MFNNFMCAIVAMLAIAVIAAECNSSDFNRAPAVFSGAQPGADCEYPLTNTLPPTYAE